MNTLAALISDIADLPPLAKFGLGLLWISLGFGAGAAFGALNEDEWLDEQEERWG